MGDGLQAIWGDQFQLHELVPLREEDVALAATEGGIDAEPFVEEIKAKGVGALASKLVTLNFSRSMNRLEVFQTRRTHYTRLAARFCVKSRAAAGTKLTARRSVPRAKACSSSTSRRTDGLWR